MTITINRQYTLFLLLFYTMIFNEPLADKFSFFQYEDEFFALLAIPIMVFRVCTERQVRNYSGCAPWLAGFAIFTLLGSVYFHYQDFMRVALPDCLLCLKFWMGIYAAKELFRGFDLPRFARSIYFHIRLVTWTLLLLTIANMLFHIFPLYDDRYGIGSNSLFYELPVTLVSVCALLMVMLIALRGYTNSGFFHVLALVLLMISTLRSKGFALAAVFALMYGVISARKRKFSLKTLFVLVPVAVVASWSQIKFYFVDNADTSARAQLLRKSFVIAKDHFPVGAGFGTYGSYYSQEYYSPLYYRYGLNNLWGLSEEYGNFICDSFWPMILGQSGYFGLACYIGALVMLICKLLEMKRWNKFLFASGLAAVLHLLMDSVSGTAFVHPQSMPVAMWIGLLLAMLPEKERVIGQGRTLVKN